MPMMSSRSPTPRRALSCSPRAAPRGHNRRSGRRAFTKATSRSGVAEVYSTLARKDSDAAYRIRPELARTLPPRCASPPPSQQGSAASGSTPSKGTFAGCARRAYRRGEDCLLHCLNHLVAPDGRAAGGLWFRAPCGCARSMACGRSPTITSRCLLMDGADCLPRPRTDRLSGIAVHPCTAALGRGALDFDVLVQRRFPWCAGSSSLRLVRVRRTRVGDSRHERPPTRHQVLEFETLEGFQRGFASARATRPGSRSTPTDSGCQVTRSRTG